MQMKDLLGTILGKDVVEDAMKVIAKRDEVVKWFAEAPDVKKHELTDAALKDAKKKSDVFMAFGGTIFFEMALKRLGIKADMRVQARLVYEVLLAQSLGDAIADAMEKSQSLKLTASQIDAMADAAHDTL